MRKLKHGTRLRALARWSIRWEGKISVLYSSWEMEIGTTANGSAPKSKRTEYAKFDACSLGIFY